MKKGMHIQKLTLSAMFLALAFIMPFITGQIPQIGAMLCPMHIPVLLCGFFCGGPWGFGVGLFAPILRSAMLGMPPLFPVAFCMAFELAMYGLVAGVLHNRLPKKRLSVYASLIVAMVAGRIVWGIAMLCCLGFDLTKFGLEAFFAGAVLNAIPGILIQIILVPILVFAIERVVNRSE